MDWLICGSIPDDNFPLTCGTWEYREGCLSSPDTSLPRLSVKRGTPALAAAAVLCLQHFHLPAPRLLLCGDTGSGSGSRELYRRLAASVTDSSAPDGITFHYLFPDLDGHNRVLATLQGLARRPVLVADAGFMYVAKMSGYAAEYDLFTPDMGELAFLADEKAPHPFYTRGFLLADSRDAENLISLAYQSDNAARWLIVKGAEDHIVEKGRILATVREPQVAALEAIGGTGDLVTGLVTGLLASGKDMQQAATAAAQAARSAGELAKATPATQIADILPHIPEALSELSF